MSSVASCTTASSSKKSVRFCIENVSVNPGEDTPVEDILQQVCFVFVLHALGVDIYIFVMFPFLPGHSHYSAMTFFCVITQLDEMLISDKRAHKRRKGNSSIAISVQDNHNDNIIEVEVKSPAVEKKISDDMRDESFSVDRGCHHFTTSMGCIDIDLSKHVDDLLESTIQNSQKAWKELRQATKSNSYSSNEEVMYRVMCYMDKQSHLLEETGAAMDETASWLQRGEGVVAELQASTQYFGDAILLSMGCQTDEKDIHHRRSKHERKGEAFLYPQSSE
ncbi:MAG: hypothetical protein SGARI_003650 [Bacillariaceae sp.]